MSTPQSWAPEQVGDDPGFRRGEKDPIQMYQPIGSEMIPSPSAWTAMLMNAALICHSLSSLAAIRRPAGWRPSNGAKVLSQAISHRFSSARIIHVRKPPLAVDSNTQG